MKPSEKHRVACALESVIATQERWKKANGHVAQARKDQQAAESTRDEAQQSLWNSMKDKDVIYVDLGDHRYRITKNPGKNVSKVVEIESATATCKLE